jgi:FG-GAP-like repeat
LGKPVHNSISKTILLAAAASLAFSCGHFKKNSTHVNVPDSNIEKGRQLAAAHCQSCHSLPDPSLLDARSWAKGVLPVMGPRLGIFDFGTDHYPTSRNDMNLDKNYYPAKPQISKDEWQYIIDYYTSLSPDSLPGQQRKYAVQTGLPLFTIVQPAIPAHLPTTCMVQIDTLARPGQLLMADMITKDIFRYNSKLELIDSFHNKVAAVGLERQGNAMIACNIGVMNPNNGKYGTALRLSTGAHGEFTTDSTVYFEGLARPVQVSEADFNSDGQPDYLVCEFGHLQGALSWMENKGNNKFERHVIRGLPGAIKAWIRDVNKDGRPDIWALFTQGEEGIFLFTNKGKGDFQQEELLRFPPVNGSSYFELADFNNDGHADILYTCGDNADYSAVLKPYHGVYIYLNDGSNHFTQSFFFAMHGCFKAMARDFDGDGDLDIASIAFFADYNHQPDQSFIYLENRNKLDFRPFSIPGTAAGRWLTMDAGDLNGDGKIDLVLGNFSVAPSAVKGAAEWKKAPPFIVLQNTGKK